MISWIEQNIGTIAVLLVVLAVVGFILYRGIKNRKSGKTTCGNGCAGCPYSGRCHENSK